MPKLDQIDPFHAGELKAQARAGVGDVAQWAGGFIRDYLPEQHRAFHTNLPFLVISGADADGHTWVTMVDGSDDFASSPNPRRIALDVGIDGTDPLAATIAKGTNIGVLGIDLATRRRNRFSGHIRAAAQGYGIDIHQTFGNCPQYIHERAWTRAPKASTAKVTQSASLTPGQIAQIGQADTMFIGSGHQGKTEAASNGFDASHRGGAPGFVKVADPTHLHIPDYAGNNFFNTIGNLVSDPRIGLLFVAFETGGLLHITGRASINWDPRSADDPDARRMINVEIDSVLERPAAVGLRWSRQDHLSRPLEIAKRVKESGNITSFYLQAVDGRALDPFKAGQHLPIEVQIPGQVGISKRSYSLSGAPDDLSQYRLSIKREDKGLVSRFIHDQLREGDIINARKPSGDFGIPCSDCPLVLVSAGVGLTPMVAALHAVAQQRNRDVWYVHGTRNSNDHAMKSEVNALIQGNPRLHRRIFFSRSLASDTPGKDYDVQGRITAADLIAIGAGPDAQYMLCGPVGFLAGIRLGLEAAGVPADHIHLETFGPTGSTCSKTIVKGPMV